MSIPLPKFIWLCLFFLAQTYSDALVALGANLSESEPTSQLVILESNVPAAPPTWAVLERELMRIMSQAALKYTQEHTRSGDLLLEYDPRRSEELDRTRFNLTNVHEHHWLTLNPVTTEAWCN
ncbi:MAG: hypothetical protein AB1898_26455 [Acidobacteriota bacterium]